MYTHICMYMYIYMYVYVYVYDSHARAFLLAISGQGVWTDQLLR